MIEWQAVFWDFDGVVLDSVHVKTKAFARMFSNYGPDIEQKVVNYHLAHGGVSRFEKFKYYYQSLLNRPISDHKLVALGKEFSGLVFEEVLTAPFIPGTLNTLQVLLQKNIPSYVVSGTPEEEVRKIVVSRELSVFFQEVYGSPKTKVEIIDEIIKRKGYATEKCLFIGDAMTDFDAANESGTRFVGVVPVGQESPFPAGTNILSTVDIEVLTTID